MYVYFTLFETFKRNNLTLPDERLEFSTSLEDFVDNADKRIFKLNFNFTHDAFILAVFTTRVLLLLADSVLYLFENHLTTS